MSGVVVLLFSFVFLGGGIYASAALHSFWILAVVAVIWLLTVIGFSYLTGVAGQVYRCALFVYASEGTIPQPYNSELLQMAWKMKK